MVLKSNCTHKNNKVTCFSHIGIPSSFNVQIQWMTVWLNRLQKPISMNHKPQQEQRNLYRHQPNPQRGQQQ